MVPITGCGPHCFIHHCCDTHHLWEYEVFPSSGHYNNFRKVISGGQGHWAPAFWQVVSQEEIDSAVWFTCYSLILFTTDFPWIACDGDKLDVFCESHEFYQDMFNLVWIVFNRYKEINLLCPCDDIWWHRPQLTLVQLMAWCLMAPSHYLTQCWLTMKEIIWYLFEGNVNLKTEDTNLQVAFK